MKRRTEHGYAGNETGAVAVMVGVMVVLFIGCVALAVDLGMLHNVKVQLQRAADASALAGALQLDTASDQDGRADAAARAAAAANRVQGVTGFAPDGWVDNDSITVKVGHWDTDVSATNRFNYPVDVNTGNAVQVIASLEVQYIFGRIFRIFNPARSNTTTVKADAIAVNDTKPGLPIALLSCIPSNTGMGTTVGQIFLYKFADDNNDTAGWTSLTYGLAASTIANFFTPEGNQLFKKILYGTGESHGGLENTRVQRNCGDSNHELNIVCGLGPDFVPDAQAANIDPLTYNPLPRWDNTVAFRRVWTMDEVLAKGDGEADTAYQTRLAALKAAASSGDYTTYESTYGNLPTAYNSKDGRFGRYIELDNKGIATPLFGIPLLEAGYPLVSATNGTANSVIQAFIDMIADNGIFKSTLASINEPLNETATAPFNTPRSHGGGETVSVTTPIIFAGECDGWPAGGGSVQHYYIGTANLLITRIWQNPTAASCNEASNPVQVFDFTYTGSPPLDGNLFSCVSGPPGGGMEGLIVPKAKDEERKHVYLVE